MKFELNTTPAKLGTYLETAARIARQNASRTNKPEISDLWSAEAADIQILINELKTGQADLAQTVSKK